MGRYSHHPSIRVRVSSGLWRVPINRAPASAALAGSRGVIVNVFSLGPKQLVSYCKHKTEATVSTNPEPFCACAPGYLSPCRFFSLPPCGGCVPALRVPLVHSLINHVRKKNKLLVVLFGTTPFQLCSLYVKDHSSVSQFTYQACVVIDAKHGLLLGLRRQDRRKAR